MEAAAGWKFNQSELCRTKSIFQIEYWLKQNWNYGQTLLLSAYGGLETIRSEQNLEKYFVKSYLHLVHYLLEEAAKGRTLFV